MKELKFYENMLELHDEHTFWKFENETATDINYEEIFLIMEKYFHMFKQKFGIKLYRMGRSGRHICIEDTDYNRRHYKSMKNYAIKLEKQFVEEFNNIDFRDIQEMTLREYFKTNYILKINIINNIIACISVEDDELVIELSRDENYFEKVNLENLSEIIWLINFETKINDLKDILIYSVLNRYITEHM